MEADQNPRPPTHNPGERQRSAPGGRHDWLGVEEKLEHRIMPKDIVSVYDYYVEIPMVRTKQK